MWAERKWRGKTERSGYYSNRRQVSLSMWMWPRPPHSRRQRHLGATSWVERPRSWRRRCVPLSVGPRCIQHGHTGGGCCDTCSVARLRQNALSAVSCSVWRRWVASSASSCFHPWGTPHIRCVVKTDLYLDVHAVSYSISSSFTFDFP